MPRRGSKDRSSIRVYNKHVSEIKPLGMRFSCSYDGEKKAYVHIRIGTPENPIPVVFVTKGTCVRTCGESKNNATDFMYWVDLPIDKDGNVSVYRSDESHRHDDAMKIKASDLIEQYNAIQRYESKEYRKRSDGKPPEHITENNIPSGEKIQEFQGSSSPNFNRYRSDNHALDRVVRELGENLNELYDLTDDIPF